MQWKNSERRTRTPALYQTSGAADAEMSTGNAGPEGRAPPPPAPRAQPVETWGPLQCFQAKQHESPFKRLLWGNIFFHCSCWLVWGMLWWPLGLVGHVDPGVRALKPKRSQHKLCSPEQQNQHSASLDDKRSRNNSEYSHAVGCLCSPSSRFQRAASARLDVDTDPVRRTGRAQARG